MNINITKGLDLKIAGEVVNMAVTDGKKPDVCAIYPDDFPGFVPKVCVKEGDEVAQGAPILYDKIHTDVCLVSPVAGTVKAVVRGERRKIMRVEIESTDRTDSTEAQCPGKDDMKGLAEWLGKTGMLARFRQRPYDIVPNPADTPRDIFVTAIDSAPLSPGLMCQLGGDAKLAITKGVEIISRLTSGKVYISHGRDWTLGDIAGAEMVTVEGPHPSGNAGIQIANIAPVNKGEIVWCCDIATVYKIGQLAATGHIDTNAIVAVTGPEVNEPHLVRTVEGARIGYVTDGCMKDTDNHLRIISGNVLTGVKVSTDDFLHFPYRQITVIDEGDDAGEFMGWASLSPNKMSTSRSFPGHFLHRLFKPDARILGGRRAMIMSGEYDRVLPMDIMAEYLLKSIMAKDIDEMEKLGIYEVAPEDFALCEYVDTSKLPVQQIVRNGLDYLRKELQ